MYKGSCPENMVSFQGRNIYFKFSNMPDKHHHIKRLLGGGGGSFPKMQGIKVQNSSVP